ncbi:hypothetical protein B0G69_6375 [Paraburkholderia sp. RAU2J]|uniref:hypothetical protein n=1 Tax=Paraburkholderia sp. RAU2J TaxID=1938810 RepID=UPI000EB55165|nr:hypothetical protein [Paraburkholderia sp. RAU2J]RKT22878.1 hypothetical protein B0G69_6375 [Paraburkholderia sp. RAU2J]
MNGDAEYHVVQIEANESRQYSKVIQALASRFQTRLLHAFELSWGEGAPIDESPATIQMTEPDCGLRVAVISNVRRAEHPVARLLQEMETPVRGTAFVFVPDYIHLELLGPIDQKLNGYGLVVKTSEFAERAQMNEQARTVLVKHADKYFHQTLPHLHRLLSHAS